MLLLVKASISVALVLLNMLYIQSVICLVNTIATVTLEIITNTKNNLLSLVIVDGPVGNVSMLKSPIV
jgi:hypothetical protein